MAVTIGQAFHGRRVLLTGGNVLAVRAGDLPAEGPAAALLRYVV